MGMIRCLGCMECHDDAFRVCPHCGYLIGTKVKEAYHLVPGTVLNQRYIIGRVLGYGGFGVTYIGFDSTMKRKVAIKEYFPTEYATRSSGTVAITVFSGEKEEQYLNGISKFSDEAKRLANLEEVSGVVRIHDVFAENNTAYIVMEYLEGETLKSRLQREEKIPVEEAVSIILPILEALKEVHASGLLHRDISPDNIFLTNDGGVKLLDFGAARFANSTNLRSLSVIVKDGYAPEEQYRSKGNQGSWTDVYACGATMYKMVTGVTPTGAMERREKDELERPSKLGIKIDRNTETAIMNAMNVRIQDRTQTAEDFERELTSYTAVKSRKSHLKGEDSGKWPGWLKITLAGAGIIVVTVLVLILTGVIEFKTDRRSPKELADDEVRMPGVQNVSAEEAVEILTANELNPHMENALYNDDIKEGFILWQQYEMGTILKKHTMVEIRISIGRHTEPLLNLVGKQQKEAEDALKKAGFENVVIEEVVSSTGKGLVDHMSPEPGAEYPVDEPVTLYISRGTDFDRSKEATIPNLIGKTQEQAKVAAKEARVMIEIREAAQYDPSKKEGEVVDQSPAAGTKGHEGDVLVIFVNMKNMVRVPGIRKGESKSVVEARLKNVGLVPKYVYQDSEEMRDTVLSVSVASGTEVEKGTVITVIISSKKEEKVSVPSLVGLTEADARSALAKAGLNISVSYVESTETPGTVLEQSKSSGTKVVKGTTITINVVRKAAVSVPNLCNYSESQIKSVLQDAGLSLESVSRTHDTSHSTGDVIGQNPGAGSSVDSGSKVIVTVCDNTTITVYRYREVIDWEYMTTSVNSAPGSDWVREKNPTSEGDVTTYYWKRAVWSDWSAWSTERVQPSSERMVETEEQFLY